MTDVTAIILAAGSSSRMGEANKLFLDLKGRTLVEWVIQSVHSSRAKEIVIVGNEFSMSQLNQYVDNRTKLIDNQDYKLGMTSSIQAGVRAVNPENGMMICLGDLPLVQPKTYDRLISGFEQSPQRIIVPTFQNEKGNPVIFPPEFRAEILNHTETNGCKDLITKNPECIVMVEGDVGILRDIDTIEEYEDLNRDLGSAIL